MTAPEKNVVRQEHTVKQGGLEWHMLRMGIPTASRFDALIAPKTRKPRTGDTPRTYLHELLAERLTGRMADHGDGKAMQRGLDLEPKARAWYKWETGRKVRQTGIVTLAGDGWRCGASPDGLCEGEERGLEIKCPTYANLIGAIEDGGAEYMLQVQGGMWVCGLARWDLVLFSDTEGIPSVIIPCEADAELHATFAEVIPRFCRELDALEVRMIARGAVKQAPRGSDEAYERLADGMAPAGDAPREVARPQPDLPPDWLPVGQPTNAATRQE